MMIPELLPLAPPSPFTTSVFLIDRPPPIFPDGKVPGKRGGGSKGFFCVLGKGLSRRRGSHHRAHTGIGVSEREDDVRGR